MPDRAMMNGDTWYGGGEVANFELAQQQSLHSHWPGRAVPPLTHAAGIADMQLAERDS